MDMAFPRGKRFSRVRGTLPVLEGGLLKKSRVIFSMGREWLPTAIEQG